MYMYSVTEQDFQKNFNDVKEILINSLVKEEFLTQEDADKILENYVVVVHKKGWFGSVIDKILKLDDKGFYVRVVKLT